jgi:hypothetical protein
MIFYLKDDGVLRNLKFGVQRVPPIQISSQNGKMQVLFNKFHRRINLMAFLITIMGSRNKKTNSEYCNLTYLGYSPYKFRLRRVKTCVSLRKFHPRTNLMALLVTILGSGVRWVNGCASVSYSFQHINSYLSCLHGAPTGNAFSG